MSAHRGWLTETGRVVRRWVPSIDPGHRARGRRWTLDRSEQVVAEVKYVETRYNLRRVLVARRWIIEPLHRRWQVEGSTRADAIERYREQVRRDGGPT